MYGRELSAIFVMRYIPEDVFPEIRAHLQWWKEDRQKQTRKAFYILMEFLILNFHANWRFLNLFQWNNECHLLLSSIQLSNPLISEKNL